MTYIIIVVSSLLASISVSIVEPLNGESYDGNWLTVKAFIENENEVPDSVSYTLNAVFCAQIPRLITDWPTYMQNQTRNGFTESAGPSDESVLWTAPVTNFDHTFQSCAVVGDVMYYCQDSVYAFDALSGEVLWSYPTLSGDDAPLVSDDRLYWASDSIYCFNLTTHQPEWIVDGGDSKNSNPLLYNGKLYCAVVSFGAQGMIVRCFNSVDGSQIWQKWYAGRMQGSFSVWDDMLIFPSNNGPLYAVDPESGDVIWENHDSDFGYWDTSPCIVDGVVFIGGNDSRIRAIHAWTGETIWSTLISPAGSLEATPAYHNGIVVCGNQSTLIAVNATNGQIIWQSKKNIHGSPAIAGDVVYWGSVNNESLSFDSLYAADLYTGEILWSFMPDSLGWPLFSTPAISDGLLYYPVANGYLYAFGTGKKYTYLDDLYAQIGTNELIVTSWDDGIAVASDTINFTVTQTGISLEPSRYFGLCASPNPLVANASVSFTLDEPGMVSLKIFDLTGRAVSTLVDQQLSSGEHAVQWNGRGDDGQPLSSGLYFCRVTSGGVSEMTGLCVLR